VLQVAYATILLALATGIVGYVIGQRYVDARAREMGRASHDVRATSVTEGGSTAFEDHMNFEVLLGTFGGSRNPQTLALGRRARRWSFVSVALACVAIAILAANEYL
jgi:hypothetical protein